MNIKPALLFTPNTGGPPEKDYRSDYWDCHKVYAYRATGEYPLRIAQKMSEGIEQFSARDSPLPPPRMPTVLSRSACVDGRVSCVRGVVTGGA